MKLFWATGLSHVIELGRDGETEGGKGERGSEKKKRGGGIVNMANMARTTTNI